MENGELWLWCSMRKVEGKRQGREATNGGPPRFWHAPKLRFVRLRLATTNALWKEMNIIHPAPFFTKLEVCVESIVVSFLQ
jgi:hypothetical protein